MHVLSIIVCLIVSEKRMFSLWLLLAMVRFLTVGVSGQFVCTATVEAENGYHDGGRTMYRSRASGGVTVWLKEGESLSYQMHFNGSCSIRLSYIRYSNDGSEDTVQVFINDTLLGSFETSGYSNYGYNWNHFYIRDGFSDGKLLLHSQYLLNLFVLEADFYGVEIDLITMKLNCSTLYDNEDDECQGSLIAFEANVNNKEESSENQGSLTANEEESSEKTSVQVGIFIGAIVGIIISLVLVVGVFIYCVNCDH